VRIYVPIRAGITASFATVMTAGLFAAPVLATPAQAASTHASAHASATKPARLPLSAAQLRADQRRYDVAQQPRASLTGLVRTATGAPLADVCVTAYGPSGAITAVTRSNGRFLINGVRPGKYKVQYRTCDGASAQYLPEWYGDILQRGQSRSVIVTGSTLTPVQALSPVTLYPANSNLGDLPSAVVPQHGSDVVASDPFGRLTTGPTSPSVLMKSLAKRFLPNLSELAKAKKSGRVAGVVTSPNGKGLQGICVEVVSANGGLVTRTGKNGSYSTPKLPAGTYFMAFYALCGNNGNWLFEIYKNIFNPDKTPSSVRIKSGQTTHISAVMKEGGEISGSVTGPGGRKLSNICVYPLTNSPAGELVFNAVSHRGVYHIRSVAPGRYQIGFAPCEQSTWAPTLWPDTQNENTAPYIRVTGSRHVGNIDEVMQPGGIITGTVTAATPAATPLAGMCALAQENGGLFDTGSVATNSDGDYEIYGLAPGSYSVQFYPGCNSNANYVGANYPGNVNVVGGATTSGINGALPVGAIISGKVTSATTGKPITGICVGINTSQLGEIGLEITDPSGDYSIDQLPVGTYQVQFSGGCGNPGSYAPQGWDNTNVLEPQNIDLSAAGQDDSDISAALQPGPVIAGTVTDSSGRRLSGICVYASTASGVLFGAGQTEHGRYRMSDLGPGSYEVIFTPGCGDNADLAETVFKTSLSSTTAATVSVSSGTLNGVNAVMHGAGGISGDVRAKKGSVALSCIILTGVSGSAKGLFGEILTLGGSYEVTGVPVGGYQVTFDPACFGIDLAAQWYKDKPSPAGATTVVVRASHIARHISSLLVPGGSIIGTITSGTKPVHNMCVEAQNVNQVLDFGGAITKPNGKYYIRGLNSGVYELYVSPCGKGSNFLAAEVLPEEVQVTAPHTAKAASASVPAAAYIKGTVLAGSPATGNGAAGACVEAYATNGSAYNGTNTGLDGTFRIPSLPAGKYLVYVGDPTCSFSEPDLAPQWYLGQPTPSGATSISVTSGATTTISNATLAQDGSISGIVTGTGHSPLGGVCVAAFATIAGSGPVYSVTSGTTGNYSITDLPAGQYEVEFSSGCGAVGYHAQWWKHKPSQQTATIVTVTAGTATTGIGAMLSK
jgi:Carboxypeptidase regulatory-like domain